MSCLFMCLTHMFADLKATGIVARRCIFEERGPGALQGGDSTSCHTSTSSVAGIAPSRYTSLTSYVRSKKTAQTHGASPQTPGVAPYRRGAASQAREPRGPELTSLVQGQKQP